MNPIDRKKRMHPKPPIAPVAIVGSGPAGLMVAHQLASAGYSVQLFEKRSGLGRKILIAGSSGLNISYEGSFEESLACYQGQSNQMNSMNQKDQWNRILSQFTPRDWLDFVEKLGLETFRGTSRRYFIRGLKGSSLLSKWTDSLKNQGVQLILNQECTGFEVSGSGVSLSFGDRVQDFSAVCFCLGGGSWEPKEIPLRWPRLFTSKNLAFREFYSSNAGFKVDWSEAFLAEAEGLPLKSIVLHSKRGSRAGEVMITRYGLEGTPVYALTESGEVYFDLKPSLSEVEILTKLKNTRENLSPLRRVKKNLNLSPAALALIFHYCSPDIQGDLQKLVSRIKRFPVILRDRQPLVEAISSAGGLNWNELDSAMMIHRFPGVFAAGEMLDWDAPTGGFLIQGCVSQGYLAAKGIVSFLEKRIF